MIDMNHSVYIEYVKLNSNSSARESQKDLIYPILSKEIFPNKNIIEIDQPTQFQSKYWTIQCKSCPIETFIPNAMNPVQNDKPKERIYWESFQKNENKSNLHISYLTVDNDQKYKKWEIEISESKNYAIKKGDKIKIIYHPTEALSIEGTGRALENGILGDKIQIEWDKNIFKNNFNKRNVNETAVISEIGVVEYGVL